MVKTKKAIAMIELIFALVIMGIVLMSAPMLIQQSIKSSNIALQQEAIVVAASQTAIILSMNWDENNTDAGETPILDASRSSFPFPLVGLNMDTDKNVSGRNIKDGSTVLSPSAIGKDANETDYTDFDDVDDYDGSTFGLMLFNSESSSADVGEYVDTNISISTTVRYTKEDDVFADITSGSFSNVKAIQVNLTSKSGIEELDKNITFKAFSCNLGTYSVNGKELP